MNRTRCIALGIVLGSMISLPIYAAGDDNDFSLQRFGMSLDQVKQAAAQGDPDAEYALGYMYYYGQGVVHDEQSARMWIGKAAAQGQQQAVKALDMLTTPSPNQNPNYNPLATTSKTVANPSPYGANTVPPAAIPGASNKLPPNLTNQPSAVPVSNKPNIADTSPPIEVSKLVPNGSQTNDVVSKSNNASDTQVTSISNQPDQPGNIINNTSKIKHARVAQHRAPSQTETSSISSKKLLEAPSNYYTVQLLGSHHRSEATDFIRQYNLQSKATYYLTRFQDKPWYVVVYGIYPTDHEAEKALRKLPAPVQKLNPWIKSLASVKAGMKLAEGG